MKNGYWIPISKGFKKDLPHDREYTELEAAYSLQIDYDCKNKVTITGYANLWRWSKGKVYRFLERMNIKIKYPENTKIKRNQNGLITGHKTDLKRTKDGLIRLIENNGLHEETDLKRTKDGLKTDLKQVTTIKPKNLKPKKEEIYSQNSDEFRLSKLLYALIKKRNPKQKEPNLQVWADHIEKTIRIDKRTPMEVETVIMWCQDDDFWQNNILSTEKLRKQYDQIFLKMNNKKSDNPYKLNFNGK